MPNQIAIQEHILVCLSSSPSNERIIKSSAQMAEALDAKFTALYVKTPISDRLNRDNNERLEKHIRLAETLGAEIVTVYGEDIPLQIIEFARVSKVTKIVLGHSNAKGHSIFKKQTLVDRIIKIAPNLDIHIIPDYDGGKKHHIDGNYSGVSLPTMKNIGITIGVLALSTALGFLFHTLKFTGANTITVYILGALLTALFTKNYICSGAFSVSSVFLFNFLFTEPRLSLKAYESGYPVTFAIMLIASLITGTLANKLASNTKLSANAAYRTSVMLETTQLLSKTDSEDQIVTIMAGQLVNLLNRNVVVYAMKKGKLLTGKPFPVIKGDDCKQMLIVPEKAIAKWVSLNGKRAGAFTENFGDALGLYIPVKTNDEVFCIVGISVCSKNLEPFENNILTSIIGESALAIENIRNMKEKEEISLMAENEKLRANLLRSISHDLRTPLTSISGNTENLIRNFGQIDEETRIKLLTDVYDDSQWLINLVENLLSISRISEGRMNVSMSAQLVDEVVTEALKHINRKGANHNITTDFGDELLLVRMDARLIGQVIINLVDNAVKYTPDGSDIKISAKKDKDIVYVSVADNGSGIPDDKKQDVFKMFYTGENKVADCRRSLGLGLSLCESIVNAHGGEITLTDNIPQGSVFTFTLKASEVNLNE